MTTPRPIAYFMPGPAHLFWTTGVFHLLELGRTHDVVIVTDDGRYDQSPDFQTIRELEFVLEHVQIVGQRLLSRHLLVKRALEAATAKYPPDLLYLHNMNYIEDFYLLRLFRSRGEGITRVFFQNGRLTGDFRLDFQYRIAMDAKIIHEKMHLPWPIATALVKLRGMVLSFLNYTVFPMLLTGKQFRPWYNVYTGVITSGYCEQWNTATDQVFAYVEYEADIYRKVGLRRVRAIDHPAKAHRRDLAQLLGRSTIVHDQIVILPSVGFTTELQKTRTDDEVVGYLSQAWSLALSELEGEHPAWPMVIKLHPAAANDPIWMRTIQNLKAAFAQLSAVAPTLSAEALIEASRVVAGDVSSALWWAALIGDKKVISFDYFGYPGGNELIAYDGIEVRSNRDAQG
ncbi:hypothetical protein [Devosia sp.]|uniref:hypothetical protein n=1 Tax=Devosia sp. TaxID=1871048 RepID=UPI003262F715